MYLELLNIVQIVSWILYIIFNYMKLHNNILCIITVLIVLTFIDLLFLVVKPKTNEKFDTMYMTTLIFYELLTIIWLSNYTGQHCTNNIDIIMCYPIYTYITTYLCILFSVLYFPLFEQRIK